MIEKMTKYSWILLSGEKENFLESLRELGVIDITRSEKPVDEKSAAMLASIEEAKAVLKSVEKGEDARLISLKSELAALRAEKAESAPWGEFDKERLSVFNPHFFAVMTKAFDPSLPERHPVQIVSEEGGKTYFVVLGDDIPSGMKELAAPSRTASQIQALIDAKKAEIERYSAELEARKAEIPAMEENIRRRRSDLSAYLATVNAESGAEDTLCIWQGFAPAKERERLEKEFDAMDGILTVCEDATAADMPPIKFRNNRFVKLFEPLTDMYGRPAYDGFDPTPYISIFFLLFFAMCMGDLGYGIILVIAGFLLKKVRSFASLAPLVTILGFGTMVVGFFFHTFFSVDFSQWSWIPEGLKKVMVPASIAGYDGTMILSLIIGIIHLCLAMIVKTVYATKNKGFLGSLGVWGWTLLIVGGVIVATVALIGVIDTRAVKTIIIILGIVSALGIFFLNDLHRNPLLNVGSGLWEAYNTATGLLGDILSYLRLYALGLAGAMLGFAFNNLAGMALGDGGPGWIPFVLIVIIGHTLNLAMAALGAFVHPLRLNFLEFFKNSGYEGLGKKYNPLTK